MWFRRDRRLGDHPALAAALGTIDGDPGAGATQVLPLFVLDPLLWSRAGAPRQAYLLESLAALAEAMDGRLHVRVGDPAVVVPAVARAVEAGEVHISADFGPYGQARDAAVETALDADEVRLVRTGSPYAVSPGRVRKGDGTAYRVYTPFFKAWTAHGWRSPCLLYTSPSPRD